MVEDLDRAAVEKLEEGVRYMLRNNRISFTAESIPNWLIAYITHKNLISQTILMNKLIEENRRLAKATIILAAVAAISLFLDTLSIIIPMLAHYLLK